MPTPQILIPSEFDTWLSDAVQSQSDLELTVYRAEEKVIDRYREEGPDDELVTATGADTFETAVVMLDGWEEDSNGDPLVDQMPDKLVTALRDSISRVVTHWHDAPDRDVQSKSVGSRSVTYRDQADKLPRSVYHPLRPFDDRTPYSPGV